MTEQKKAPPKNSITITKACAVGGNPVKVDQVLEFSRDISEKDAKTLVQMGRAVRNDGE